MQHYKTLSHFEDAICREVFVALLKAFTIHGEHAENISPLIQVQFFYLNVFGKGVLSKMYFFDAVTNFYKVSLSVGF